MLKVDMMYALVWCLEELASLQLIGTKVARYRAGERWGRGLLTTHKLLLLLLLHCLLIIVCLRHMKMGLERVLHLLVLLLLLLELLLRVLLHEIGWDCILLLRLLLRRC